MFVCLFVCLFILGRKLNRQNCLLKEVLREREEKEEKEKSFSYAPNFSKLSDDRRISRETDSYNENCLCVRFALFIIKALRLARIEHCSGTVVTPFLPSEKEKKKSN